MLTPKLWCNPLALASAKGMDVLDGTDRRAFFKAWEKVCREKIVDRKNGLIPLAIRLDGGVIHVGACVLTGGGRKRCR